MEKPKKKLKPVFKIIFAYFQ
ncbi:hypothetical protein TrRE_jg9182, partial [Triparma retinervis]